MKTIALFALLGLTKAQVDKSALTAPQCFADTAARWCLNEGSVTQGLCCDKTSTTDQCVAQTAPGSSQLCGDSTLYNRIAM